MSVNKWRGSQQSANTTTKVTNIFVTYGVKRKINGIDSDTIHYFYFSVELGYVNTVFPII